MAKRRARRKPACARGRLWLLFLLVSPFSSSGQTAFAGKSSLEAGLAEWCADPASAAAAHGAIGSWDVSAVTDMESLVRYAPCVASFNEDIDDWNMGQVTNTVVRRAPLEPHGL